MTDIDKLIEEGFEALKYESNFTDFSDKDIFASGAKFIIGYLVKKGKL